MLRHVDIGRDDSQSAGDDDAGSTLPRPAQAGDLAGLLDSRPVFCTRVHGYDRIQVDNYVAWAEDELAAAHRAGDHLMARLTVCAAELADFRRKPPSAPVVAGPDLVAVSQRVSEILRLATDEAAEIIQAATEEADQIVADARLESEERLHKTTQLREASVALVEQMRDRVVRERAEAVEVLDRARREAEEILSAAAAERDRLAVEAAEQLARDEECARQDRDAAAALAAGRLLAVQDEVDDLRRQRDEARESLQRLTDQIGEALHAASAVAPDERIVRSVPQPVAS